MNLYDKDLPEKYCLDECAVKYIDKKKERHCARWEWQTEILGSFAIDTREIARRLRQIVVDIVHTFRVRKVSSCPHRSRVAPLRGIVVHVLDNETIIEATGGYSIANVTPSDVLKFVEEFDEKSVNEVVNKLWPYYSAATDVFLACCYLHTMLNPTLALLHGDGLVRTVASDFVGNKRGKLSELKILQNITGRKENKWDSSIQ